MAEITNLKGPSVVSVHKSQADDSVKRLITQVGERVRTARERKGISRRVLSEMSGVSPRYLAQLEFGEGNISIGLLQRVAIALDHRIEWIVGEEDPWSSDYVQLNELFRAANAQDRSAALRLLSRNSSEDTRARRICLIGLRGAGKSTLGGMLGKTLDLPFVELNGEIEAHSGMPIAEVMALYGTDGYRRLESQALERVIGSHEAMVLAVAGGIVGAPETYNRLLAHFHTIWLRATPEDHMNRVRAQGDERPMEGYPEAMDQLNRMLQSREALYARAAAVVDTSAGTREAALATLVKTIEARGILAE